MNKDEMKMIEEMAKVLCDKNCEECSSKLLVPCGYKSYCTKLYNAGYRKIADDEIVIKKGELGKVVISHERADLVDMLNQEIRELQKALTNDLDKGDYGEFENGFSQGYAKAKQETAREILQEFKTRIKPIPKNHFTRLEIDWEIAILAQKYGIELE